MKQNNGIRKRRKEEILLKYRRNLQKKNGKIFFSITVVEFFF